MSWEDEFSLREKRGANSAGRVDFEFGAPQSCEYYRVRVQTMRATQAGLLARCLITRQ